METACTVMEEVRTDKRSARLLRGTLVSASGESHDLLIKNISLHGIGGRFSGTGVSEGEAVKLIIPNIGTFDATVRWLRKGGVGLHLVQEINPDTTLFHNSRPVTETTTPYHVPDRFQPSLSTYRPGFRSRP